MDDKQKHTPQFHYSLPPPWNGPPFAKEMVSHTLPISNNCIACSPNYGSPAISAHQIFCGLRFICSYLQDKIGHEHLNLFLSTTSQALCLICAHSFGTMPYFYPFGMGVYEIEKPCYYTCSGGTFSILQQLSTHQYIPKQSLHLCNKSFLTIANTLTLQNWRWRSQASPC